MEPNTQLDTVLDEAGMSRAGLAARVNRASAAQGRPARYDHTSVGRWVKGQRPRGRVPELICEILSRQLGRPVTLDDIGMGCANAVHGGTVGCFVDRATALWRFDRQRGDLQDTPLITGMGAVAPVWQWENPPDDADLAHTTGPRVSPAHVAMVNAARARYESMYRQVGGVVTRGRVVGFLTEHTAPLLRGSYPDQTGRELFRAAGGLAAIAGICAYDSDAQGLAQRYFHQALRLAKASADRRFGGYVVALLVNQALCLADYHQAIAFAEAGLRAAGGHLSPALATDLYAMQAKAYAGMGAAADAYRRMALAERTAARIRPADEPPETGYIQPGLLEAHLAEALISLGEYDQARRYAEHAAGTRAHARGRVHRLATLATAELGQGEVDAAATSVLRMVELAGGMESRRLRDRFSDLRRALARHHTASAVTATDRIDEALSVPL